MSFEIFYIFAVIPIMFIITRIRGQVKPRIKAWLIAKAQTRPNLTMALNNSLLGLYMRMFTNSIVISSFIFLQLMVVLNVIPASPPDWVQLYAIGFATLAFGAMVPVFADARDQKGFFADIHDKLAEKEKY